MQQPIDLKSSTTVQNRSTPTLDLSEPGKIVPIVTPPRSDPVVVPPRWLCRLLLWFRLGLALFVLMSVLLGATGCTASAASVPWQAATNVFSVPQLEAILDRNSSGLELQTAQKSMRVWTIPAASGRVAVLDFNNPGLCGSAGCLYTGYLLRDQQQQQPPVEVFQARLQPQLPRSKPLFSMGQTQDAGLPCLQVWQLDAPHQLKQLQFCYDGRSYQRTSQTLFKEN